MHFKLKLPVLRISTHTDVLNTLRLSVRVKNYPLAEICDWFLYVNGITVVKVYDNY